MKIRVFVEIEAFVNTQFVNTQVVYKDFADNKSALEFMKQVVFDKHMKIVKVEDVEDVNE